MSFHPHIRAHRATRWTRPLLSIALAAACAPAAARSAAPPAGTSPSTAAVPPPPPLPTATLPVRPRTADTGPIFVIGDSLSVGVEPYLPNLLTGRRVRFDAQVGRTTAEGVAIVRAHPAELAPTVVVGLGTNDYPSPSDFAQQVDQMINLLGNRRVLWVNVARKGYEGFNYVLIAAAQRHANMELIDWATPYSEYPQDRAGDGIHATEDGYHLRAQIIASALLSPSPSTNP